MVLRGRTTFYGVHAKAFLPTERSWTPYAFVGVARFTRKVDVSPLIANSAPETRVLQVTDDCVGLDGGVGFEQPLTGCMGLTACGHYFYSGALKHDLQWLGHDVSVGRWDFWSAEVGLTYHAPMRPGASAR